LINGLSVVHGQQRMLMVLGSAFAAAAALVRTLVG
jgi:hypothetical protein